MNEMMGTEQESHKVAWIILEAADALHLGSNKLAEFLKGSKAKDISLLGARPLYGGLLWLSMETILHCIRQLELRGYLEREFRGGDFQYPILRPSAIGRKTMGRRFPIDLDIAPVHKPLRAGESERETLRLLRQGKSIDGIAQIRGLALSTVYGHFATLISLGHASCRGVITDGKIGQIEKACETLDVPTVGALKPLLPEDISYGEIRCVLAEMKRAKGEGNG
jgi:DNA-binding CsgD family transcriptional regulator